jgi:peptide/nickel transport system substrate-binding protein
MKYSWLGSLFALLVGACSAPPVRQASSPITIRWARDPGTLDPLALANPSAVEAANLLHMALLATDYQTNTYAPALAQTLPRVRPLGDSLTALDYELRSAATWDDGHPVLATDVDFTLKLLHCPGLPNESSRAQYGFIREVRLDPANPRRFTLVCRGQGEEILVASGDFPVLPESALDPAHTLRRLPLTTLQAWPATQAPAPAVAALVQRYRQANLAREPSHLPGCGPYRLAAWDTNHQLRFRRKTPWWADKLRPAPFVLQARPQELVFTVLPDDAAATLALRRHEIDVYPQVPARIFQQLQASAKAQAEFTFYSQPTYDILTAGFNTRHPALRDKRTRQAISYLFDPAGLSAATQLGQGRRTVGLLPPGSPFYNDSLPLPALAPGKAVALLREAGWQRRADGHWWQPGAASPLALSVRYRTEEATFATTALQFQAAAAQVGIAVTLLPAEGSVLTRLLQTGDFDVYIRLLKGSPLGFNFATFLHSSTIGSGNITGFSTPFTDRLLLAIPAEGDARRKRRLLRRLQAVLRDEMPLLPLFYLPSRLIVSQQLQHVVPSGLKPGYALTALSWPAPAAPSAGSH